MSSTATEGTGSKIMQTNPDRLQLSEAVRIDTAADAMGCSVDLLIREAADQKRVLYVALAPYSATLRAVPSHESPRTARHETKQSEIVALAAHYAKALSVLGNVKIEQWQASFDGGVLDWHCWQLDVPQHVTLEQIYVWQADVDLHMQSNLGVTQQGKKNPRHSWDEYDLKRLLNESIGPDMTHEKLAEKYGVSRQFIGKQLKKARGGSTKVVDAFSGLGARTSKK